MELSERDKRALRFFESYLSEAPDDPPDMPDDQTADTPPPDMPDDTAPTEDMSADDNPPDMDDQPPGITDDAFGMEDDQEQQGDQQNQDNKPKELEGDVDHDNEVGLDDKVSAIMNSTLYQRFLGLLSTISNQLTMVKNNTDILYSISADSLDIVKSLTNLANNVRSYLNNHFSHENYSKNLLFFNKCLNLLKLLNDTFDQEVRKGIRNLK